jgi:hypothetical protein
MPWIKRNLLFVVGLAVAVALLGFGIFFYLLGNMSSAQAADEELNAKNAEYVELLERKPFPSKENIAAAQEEQARLNKFKDGLRPHFGTPVVPAGMDDASFKNLLDITVDALEKQAAASGVTLPTTVDGKFAFTFDQQRKQLEFSQKALVPLTAQLLDIQDICRVLFDAKILAVESIRRTPTSTNDVNPPSNYISKKVTTNSVTGAAIFPYEITFRCFSAELASVLAGFVNAEPLYIVKSVNVERSQTDGAAVAGLAAPMAPGLANRYGMNPGMAARYGVGAQPAAGPRPGDAPLDDKPLRVTINLEVIKLPPPPPPAPARRV